MVSETKAKPFGDILSKVVEKKAGHNPCHCDQCIHQKDICSCSITFNLLPQLIDGNQFKDDYCNETNKKVIIVVIPILLNW